MIRRSLTLVVLAGVLLSACGSDPKSVVVVRGAQKILNTETGGLGHAAAAVDVPVSVGFRDLITSIQVRPGDHVVKGQLLLTLDPSPLGLTVQAVTIRIQQALAAIARSQVSLNDARAKKPQLVPGISAQIQALQAQLALQRQLLDIAHGKAASIVAPIEGDVAAVNVIQGQAASAGKTLIELVDYSQVEITANLPITDQPDVLAGAAAEVSFPSIPDLVLTGSVVAVAPGANSNGLTFQVVVDAPNTTDKRARPGFAAYVRIKVAHYAAVALPKLAILNLDRDPTAFVVDGNRVQRRHLEIGMADGENVEILSGVKLGDQCVIVGNQGLDDGSLVRVTRVEG